MQVIDLVHSWRGDVMKFAGDAMIIAFYPDSQEMELEDAGFQNASIRCAKCACEVCLGLPSELTAKSAAHSRVICKLLVPDEKQP
jgi:hypothetical protein